LPANNNFPQSLFQHQSYEEISAKEAICFGGERTYQKRVIQLSSAKDKGNMLLVCYV
jgi:hypothetical protein